MINLIKKSFIILKNNMIFVQPLLLFLLITLTVLSYTAGVNGFSLPIIILLLSVFLLAAAFSAGWFYINKLGVIDFNETDTKEEITIKSVANFKKFFEGVGANFIKVLLSYIFIIILYLAALYAVYKLLIISIGIPGFIYELPKVLNNSSVNELTSFLNGISAKDKLNFTIWVLGLNALVIFLNYCFAVYFAVLIFEQKNIFKTCIMSTKFIFMNIIPSLFIIIFTELIYFCLNLLSSAAGPSSIALIILIILFTIYLNYYLILVFCFYHEKTKISGNNGTDLIG